MKIKISNRLAIDSRTIIRVEWRKFHPVLTVHEKYEKHLKYTLRIIAFLGIASSLIAFDTWYASLVFSITIFLVEQFFERTIIEFTTMVFQLPPGFEVDYDQWKTNGFIIPREEIREDLAHFGPSYMDEEYANKFFDYLRSWIDNGSFDDTHDDLIVSLVLEPNEEYTTYIYANSKRERLNHMFQFLGKEQELEKYGKQQQRLFMQMIYWNTLDFKDGYIIKKFLDFHKSDDSYFFTPSVIQPFGLPTKFITEKSIKKHHLKVRKREEINNLDMEFFFLPEKTLKRQTSGKTIWKRSDEVRISNDIQKAFSKAEDLGFMPSEEKSIGVINLCFSDCSVPFEAYKELIKVTNKEELRLDLTKKSGSLKLEFNSTNLIEPITLSDIPFNEVLLDEFLKVDGGGDKVVFIIGYPPALDRKIILENGMSPLMVVWNYLKR